jgi:hypothetical protein
MIIMFIWNFTPLVSLPRIVRPGKFYTAARVDMVSTIGFHLQLHHLVSSLANVLASWIGTLALATLLIALFIMSLINFNFQLPIIRSSLFARPVSGAKVISFLLICLKINQVSHLNLFSLMFGDLPLFYLIMVHAFMLFLSIILANSHGFIPLHANLMSFPFFLSFRLMLNANLIIRSNPSKQMEVANIKNYVTILHPVESIIELRAHTPINKMSLWNANTATLSKLASPFWPIAPPLSHIGLRLFKPLAIS